MILGTHPVNQVSTNPVFYSTRKQCVTSFVVLNLFKGFNLIPNTNKSAIIGNDVWVGYGALVLDGAYVTKNVEPYFIVGGVPAKHIKYRFSEQHRTFLLQPRWWDKDISWIKSKASIFSDITTFINRVEDVQNKFENE